MTCEMKRTDVLVLVGYRGTGKTTVAPLVADLLGWNWFDMDQVIVEKAGRPVREIFEQQGEAAFRDIEERVLEDLLVCQNVVIAAGGGVVVRETNRHRLKEAPVVWLKAAPETIERRIAADPATAENRPALTQLDPRKEIRELLQQREPLYAEIADLRVETDTRSPEQIARLIVDWTDSLRARGA